MKLLTAALPFALTFALTSATFAAELGNQSAVVAHEWGTLTSVAGPDGNPVQWSPLTGPPELPCFVQRGPILKVALSGLVRMETPVLYFYSPRAQELSVDVGVPPLSSITEWYPAATMPDGHLRWSSVKLEPGEDPKYPMSKGQSRYFAARNTDSTPLEVNGQKEKMLFYRGVGAFPVPLRPKFNAQGNAEIRNVSQDVIPVVILFENRYGKLGYRIQYDMKESATIEAPELTSDISGIRSVIVKALVERGGLYPKEAQAMMDTWQDSWFEEGARVIYILPRRPIDAVLPLTIQPAPTELARAYVGRIEMLSPEIKQDLDAAAASGDSVALARYGRFLEAFGQQDSGILKTAAFRQAEKGLANLGPGSCVP